jgi:uncharacterized DUF497 family protein
VKLLNRSHKVGANGFPVRGPIELGPRWAAILSSPWSRTTGTGGCARHRAGRAHEISQEEAEQALLNNPIPILEQEVEGELRYVYYAETSAGRLLAAVITERGDKLRIVTAYELSANQRRDYHQLRAERIEHDEEDA